MKRTTTTAFLLSAVAGAVLWVAPQWAAAGSPPFYRGSPPGERGEADRGARHDGNAQGGQPDARAARESRDRGPGRNDSDRGDRRAAPPPSSPPPAPPVVAAREPQRDWRGGAPNGDQRGERRGDQRDDRRGDQRWAQVPRVESNRIPDRRDGGRDDRSRRHDDDRYRNGDRGAWRDDRGRNWAHERGWYDRYRVDHFRYDRGQYRARQRYSIGYYNYPRGYSSRVWLRGQWLPFALYVNSAYYLDSYWQFDLYDPPYRARWIRVGSDALLVDIDSGEILDVIYELYW